MLVFLLLQFVLCTKSYIVLKKNTESLCTLYMNKNRIPIEKTYAYSSGNCGRIAYRVSCPLFSVIKNQRGDEFIMRHGDNNITTISYHDNMIYTDNKLYGSIVNGIFYNTEQTPIFRIIMSHDEEYKIIPLGDYSYFDVQLVILIHTSILFDSYSISGHFCFNGDIIMFLFLFVVCVLLLVIICWMFLFVLFCGCCNMCWWL